MLSSLLRQKAPQFVAVRESLPSNRPGLLLTFRESLLMNIPNHPSANSVVKHNKVTLPTQKKVAVTEAVADASGMPRELFQATDRNALQNSTLQGQLAKKLGANIKDVQVRTRGITLTGKALEKVKESGLKLGTKVAGELSGSPIWAREGWNQVHVSTYNGPDGKPAEMDHPSPIITDSNPSADPLAKMTYLFADGPKQSS